MYGTVNNTHTSVFFLKVCHNLPSLKYFQLNNIWSLKETSYWQLKIEKLKTKWPLGKC
jgi:hypothetical protein